jgi:hypothetical protein
MKKLLLALVIIGTLTATSCKQVNVEKTTEVVSDTTSVDTTKVDTAHVDTTQVKK